MTPARLVVSCTVTRNPAACTCSTHFLQQPQLALLYTTTSGPGARAAIARPPTPPTVATSSTVAQWGRPIMRLLPWRGTACPASPRAARHSRSRGSRCRSSAHRPARWRGRRPPPRSPGARRRPRGASRDRSLLLPPPPPPAYAGKSLQTRACGRRGRRAARSRAAGRLLSDRDCRGTRAPRRARAPPTLATAARRETRRRRGRRASAHATPERCESRHDLPIRFDRQERREHGYAPHEVARAVDGIDDQSRSGRAGHFTLLLAQHAQGRLPLTHQLAGHRLDRPVGFGDRTRVGLLLDAQPPRAEEREGDLVGAIGDVAEQGEPVAGLHRVRDAAPSPAGTTGGTVRTPPLRAAPAE